MTTWTWFLHILLIFSTYTCMCNSFFPFNESPGKTFVFYHDDCHWFVAMENGMSWQRNARYLQNVTRKKWVESHQMSYQKKGWLAPDSPYFGMTPTRLAKCSNNSPAGGGRFSAPPRTLCLGHFYIKWDPLKTFGDVPKKKSVGNYTFILGNVCECIQ